MTALKIKYNWQRNNKSFINIPPSGQCGYTSLGMFLSTWIKEAETDEYIAWLIDQIEPKVGYPGIGEQIILKTFPKLVTSPRLGAYGNVYALVAQTILNYNKVNKKIIWHPYGGTIEHVKKAIDSGSPVFASTMLTKFGHFVLIVGYEEESLIVHDPWGNQYLKKDQGDYCSYPDSYIFPAMKLSSEDKKSFRIFYAL